MGHPEPGIDPGHEAKRAALSKGGVTLVGVGIPCGLLGIGLFLSAFFEGFGGMINPVRPVLGLVLAAVGGFLTVFGLQSLAFGNLGRVARYRAGEALPLAKDVFEQTAPMAGDMARNLSRAVREGWQGGESKIRHACGTWNDPADRFCKGCGQPIAGRICGSWQAPNDADARFCDRCGATLES